MTAGRAASSALPGVTAVMEPTKNLDVLDWAWLVVIALVAMPLAGMLAALIALDVTSSLEAHVATALVMPIAVVMLVARRFGLSGGVALRLSLLAAMFAMVLLDLGWSGVPGS